MKHQVHINLKQLKDNAIFLQQHLYPAKICAVLKNDAYGHGLLACAETLLNAGITDFGVVDNEEVRLIREQAQFNHVRLWRIRPALPVEIDDCIKNNWQIIEQFGSIDKLPRIEQQARPVCLTLDVSMGREGFVVPTHLPALQKQLAQHPTLNIVGIMAQLAKANADDLTQTLDELSAFDATVAQLSPQLNHLSDIHIANSATALRLPDKARAFSMVRLGAALFGEATSDNVTMPAALQPCFSWKTQIAQIRTLPAHKDIGYDATYQTARQSVIATLPIGYADGLPKGLGNHGEVLINGKRCPIVGGVSSAMATVDITDVRNVNVGDEVVLIGKQGSEHITPDQLAQRASTGHLAVQTGVTAPRIYIKA